ncbi:MAG: molybdopterin molybdotransferase MoeA [Hyphomicrobiaceae bacterium]
MPRKLIDDCFRTDPRDGDRMTHDATLNLIRDRTAPVVATQSMALGEAVGAILAEDVVAAIAVPGHTNSAVDGFAFAHAAYDIVAGSRFGVEARVAAGSHGHVVVDARAAARIFTGAVMPLGLDTVVMQEDCEIDADGQHVVIPGGLKAGANVRKAGEDVEIGTPILRHGQIIRAPDIAALSSLGIQQVQCFGRPRVGIIATGDEVVRGGRALEAGEVYDVNTPLLLALSRGCTAEVTDLGVWPDRREAVTERLRDAAVDFDLLITSGGASQGEEDHISHALATLGTRHFWQIAVKPGRPLMLGQIGDTAVVGLPGNPVAVFVCFLMYVWPLLRQLGGAAWCEPRRFPLRADFSFQNRKVGRREFWRGTTRQTADGMVVGKFPRDGSGLISGLRAADGLIDIPEDVPFIEPGQIVDFIPFSEFGIVD